MERMDEKGSKTARPGMSLTTKMSVSRRSIVKIHPETILTPEYYKEITLGTMEVTEDVRDQIKELLDQMGFGSSIGKWTPSFTDYSSVQPAEMVFTDVPKEAWYYSYVKYVFEKGLMTGLSDTVFAPTEEVARAQAALILYRIGGETPSEYRPYSLTFRKGYGLQTRLSGQTAGES